EHRSRALWGDHAGTGRVEAGFGTVRDAVILSLGPLQQEYVVYFGIVQDCPVGLGLKYFFRANGVDGSFQVGNFEENDGFVLRWIRFHSFPLQADESAIAIEPGMMSQSFM